MSVILVTASLAGLLQQWQSIGVFEYVLPFMLIFAVVFGILSTSKVLGENKGILSVISLALALLAIQFPMVRVFFGTISANLAVGLSVLLAALILMGLFIDWDKENTGWRGSFAAFGGLIAVVVILVSLSSNNMIGGFWWWNQYWPHIIVAIVVVGAVIAIIATTKSGSGGKKPG